MFVKNIEETFDENEIFYCDNYKLKDLLIKKGIYSINNGYKKNKPYWIFIKSNDLLMWIKEFNFCN